MKQEHLQPPETGRGQEQIFHQDFQKESSLQDFFFLYLFLFISLAMLGLSCGMQDL